MARGRDTDLQEKCGEYEATQWTSWRSTGGMCISTSRLWHQSNLSTYTGHIEWEKEVCETRSWLHQGIVDFVLWGMQVLEEWA